jgi:hypothetical protein
MSLKLPMAVAVAIFANAPIVVFAQQSNAEPWKPTIEDAQKLVDAISGDKGQAENILRN